MTRRDATRRSATRGAGAEGVRARTPRWCGTREKESFSFETLFSSVRRVRLVYTDTVWPAYAAYERKSIINETHVPSAPAAITHIRDARFFFLFFTLRFLLPLIHVAHGRNGRHDQLLTAASTGLKNGAVAARRRCSSFIFARFRCIRRSLPPAADDASAALRPRSNRRRDREWGSSLPPSPPLHPSPSLVSRRLAFGESDEPSHVITCIFANHTARQRRRLTLFLSPSARSLFPLGSYNTRHASTLVSCRILFFSFLLFLSLKESLNRISYEETWVTVSLHNFAILHNSEVTIVPVFLFVYNNTDQWY